MVSKISIITPSFNSAGHIQRAVNSVLEQNDTDFEHIIIDGGSTDGTLEILNKFEHLKIVSETDQGQSDAMNKGFELSSGDIVVYLNSDDYFVPGVFKVVRRGFIYYKADIIVGNLVIQQGVDLKLTNTEWRYNKITHPNYYGFPYNPVCYFYKRHIQQTVGSFPVKEEYVMDYWFIIRAFRIGSVKKIDHTFGFFDIHENCKTHSVKDASMMLENTISEFIATQSYLNQIKYLLVEWKLRIFKLVRIL